MIPVLSLLVAALAVFVSPLVSWIVTKRQIEAAQQLAITQFLAPMRQGWINELRSVLTELLASAVHYHFAAAGERKVSDYRRITELVHRLELMLNLNEQLHKDLVADIGLIGTSLDVERTPEIDERFLAAHARAREHARAILKAEWNRVKTGK
jgi:hypothetical protein